MYYFTWTVYKNVSNETKTEIPKSFTTLTTKTKRNRAKWLTACERKSFFSRKKKRVDHNLHWIVFRVILYFFFFSGQQRERERMTCVTPFSLVRIERKQKTIRNRETHCSHPFSAAAMTLQDFLARLRNEKKNVRQAFWENNCISFFYDFIFSFSLTSFRRGVPRVQGSCKRNKSHDWLRIGCEKRNTRGMRGVHTRKEKENIHFPFLSSSSVFSSPFPFFSWLLFPLASCLGLHYGGV